MLDEAKFYIARYWKVYQGLEVNDGKGRNVRQGHGRIWWLPETNLLKDHGTGSTYSDSALEWFLVNE